MVVVRTYSRNLGRFIGAAALAVALTVSARASACGGFWCSIANPVEQTSEQILFVQNGDGTTTCVVDIAYQGPSEHFAWVLPVDGIPQIDVSSGIAFDRLAAQTAPQFVTNRHVEGQCDPSHRETAEDGGAAFPTYGTDAATAAVDVLAQGSVGPYDYAVIKPNPALASPAQVALDWLKNEGYDVTGVSDTVLGPYLSDGLNLIAFRLTKGTMVGSIRPVVLTYNGDKPSIPIRPTAVAAQDDMGVLVYVVSAAQAVPENYRSLVIDEAAVDWFNPTNTYSQVVSLAADEAGGQGFVTELAEPSTALSQDVFSPAEAATWNMLKTQTFADPLDLIWAANNSYRGWDGWRDAIAASVTLPPGASLDDFGRSPNAFRGVEGFSVDAQTFLDRLEKNVVGPVQHTQQLIDSRPYLTRLYTTMSPAEMTLDPVFTFNPDLAPVSNVHTADLYIECRRGIQEYDAPWRLELPQGGTVRGTGDGQWPKIGVPANRRIVQLSETGSGQVMRDNMDVILAKLAALPRTSGPSPTHDAGCAVASRPSRAPSPAMLAGAIAALAALLRRRRK
jgi:MYXO-CTERM domain-containing protein